MAATKTEEILRRLALEDAAVVDIMIATRADTAEAATLPQPTRAIARLGALIALDADPVSHQSVVVDALTAGVTTDEIVGCLFAVAPLARITSGAPAIALALGHDVEAAFEQLDGPPRSQEGRHAGPRRSSRPDDAPLRLAPDSPEWTHPNPASHMWRFSWAR